MYNSFMESDTEALALVIEYIQSCSPDLTPLQAEVMAKSDTYRCVCVCVWSRHQQGRWLLVSWVRSCSRATQGTNSC